MRNVKKAIQLLYKKKWTTEQLAKEIGMSKTQTKKLLRELKLEHFNVQREGKTVKQHRFWIDKSRAAFRDYLVSGPTVREVGIRYGLFSDVHFGCKLHDGEQFADFLKRARDDHGVKRFLFTGDLTDGIGVYRGQNTYLNSFTLEDQSDEAMDGLPQISGVEYLMIDGNHDESFIKRGAISPIEHIANQRDDVTYLGSHAADVTIGGVKIRLLHGAGGGSYAVSYPIQRYLRNVMQSGRENMPDVVHCGHYHQRVDGMFVEGASATLNGHFQDPNAWYIRRGFVGPKGGYVVDMKAKDGKKTSFNATWIGE